VCVCVSRELNIFGTRPMAYRSSHHFCGVCGFYFICFSFFHSILTAEKDCQLADRFTGTLDASTAAGNTQLDRHECLPPAKKSIHQNGKTGKIPMHPGGVVGTFYITPFSLDLRRWEPAMTPNESPPTRTGVPVHLDTGPSSL
jgi:hypothetical protein